MASGGWAREGSSLADRNSDFEAPWDYHPAEDRDLDAGQRWISPRREGGLTTRLFSGCLRCAVRIWLRLRHRFRVFGREGIPDDLPYVLVANHTSHWDALVLLAALPVRHASRTTPLAAGDVFFSGPLTKRIASLCLNAHPVWRRSRSAAGFGALRERLIRGHGACILFPEGSRSADGRLGPFQGGVGRLVAGTSVPVVPAIIDGAFESWPRHRPRPRAGVPISVTFLAPLRFDRTPDDKEGWLAIAQELEERVRGAQQARAELGAAGGRPGVC